jgi:hypothetical protein
MGAKSFAARLKRLEARKGVQLVEIAPMARDDPAYSAYLAEARAKRVVVIAREAADL